MIELTRETRRVGWPRLPSDRIGCLRLKARLMLLLLRLVWARNVSMLVPMARIVVVHKKKNRRRKKQKRKKLLQSKSARPL